MHTKTHFKLRRTLFPFKSVPKTEKHDLIVTLLIRSKSSDVTIKYGAIENHTDLVYKGSIEERSLEERSLEERSIEERSIEERSLEESDRSKSDRSKNDGSKIDLSKFYRRENFFFMKNAGKRTDWPIDG